MSGIVAAYGPFDPRLGRRMLERLAHRGPDGEGSRQVGDAWLGHRRLAVVDPEGGGQPLANDAGDVWLVGDGEIYNHRRLRADLGEQHFRTGSDHEAALRLFDRDGLEGAQRLWGTFAFAVAGEDGRFAAIRDTLGVAPLYWARRDGTVLFASELKAFDEDWRPEVEPFPTGQAWTPRDGLCEWSSSLSGPTALMRSRASDEDPPLWVFDAIRDSVVRAVETALRADVPVGAFLSGGLDSSVICAVAANAVRARGGTFHTFAAGLSDSPDLLAARRVADHIGSHHHERVYTAEEAIELVPDVIWMLESFDPMLIHSAVPNHLVATLARDDVKAVLIGEGADELFAGYSHYAEIETGEALREELLETIRGLHNLGLQRVDRVTSANGIEARIPFLDLDVVDLALALPPDWKLTREDRAEKWLLRRAFEGWLPDDLLWRGKQQFGQGTGMKDVLSDHFGRTVTEEELEQERDAVDPPLRTREELAYYRIFREHLRGIEPDHTIGRFVEA
ncbi:asparagine synthase (glutamine-hydrolyzing) [Actinomycetospora cinnamomea]|uniref:asparagine synthase (glutamine-hydrolyzing) n=1 Tax=Actinomycetospora cinnamomea TaxID=663609 RepID=A0A2U1FPY7_9PSEU|nr:asparagine synthase (glutamine-hydrolyzing) [Actinomycetospora cinnamomea]PVZ14206.1 asparagine synthase (glutamine-hydrolysing) [Actinomycetospora cinnamomea]